MSVYDDYNGVYFTLQSLKLHHLRDINVDIEFIVVDNNPHSADGRETKSFVENWAKGTYIPYTDRISTSSREQVFANATGDYTLCVDCHVLFENNAIQELLNYYDANPDTNNLIQGPLLYDDLCNYSTHFEPVWRGGMYGVWGTNPVKFKKGKPFEIPMQGMGVFSCKTSEWPGYSPHFVGFGAEEGYIHEKVRRRGGKCICLPQLRWVHRFGRPAGVPYPNIWEDRVWNYYVGWLEILGTADDPFIHQITQEFSKIISESTVLNILEAAKDRVL